MKHSNVLKEKMLESVKSVLPLVLIISLLCLTGLVKMESETYLGFLFGALLITLGIGLFTLGSEIAMTPMGDYVGAGIAKSRKIWLIAIMSFFIGAMITISEPDLMVLAEKLTTALNTSWLDGKWLLIFAVALGVGISLSVAMLRVIFGIRLRYLLLFCYGVIFVLAIFLLRKSPNFLAVAFDSGGVTTGPMTVPFLMTLGVGAASIRADKDGKSDSFGYVALCSVGPIIAVMILGIIFTITKVSPSPAPDVDFATIGGLGLSYLKGFRTYLGEVLIAVLPITAFFYLYQWIRKPLGKAELIRIAMGLVYTVVGLILFLAGANIGFMPAGEAIGKALAGSWYSWILIPVGMIIGYFIVAAEPAIHVLEVQVEEVTAGAIPRRALSVTLGIGVSLSVGLAMLRAIKDIPILYILVPGYLIALILMFFVDDTFSSIAFDSGGVASGPMTATFLIAMASGACEIALGEDMLLTNAFGIVALVAMTPLIAIQVLGLVFRIKMAKRPTGVTVTAEMIAQEDVIEF